MGDRYDANFVEKANGSVDVNIPEEAFDAARIPGRKKVCEYLTQHLRKLVNRPGETKPICWAVLQDRYRSNSPEFEGCRKCYREFYPDDPRMEKFEEFLTEHL